MTLALTAIGFLPRTRPRTRTHGSRMLAASTDLSKSEVKPELKLTVLSPVKEAWGEASTGKGCPCAQQTPRKKSARSRSCSRARPDLVQNAGQNTPSALGKLHGAQVLGAPQELPLQGSCWGAGGHQEAPRSPAVSGGAGEPGVHLTGPETSSLSPRHWQ